jgi:periplasmic protein CpxP/Spy
MKSKLLPVILLVLVLLNGVLIFMLITKPHQNKKKGPERNFLSEQLQFSKKQQEKFKMLDDIHKERVMDIERNIRKHKDILFDFIGNETINIDSLVHITGKLEAKKDLEIFTFFNSVKEICTKEQQEKFKEIIKNAITGGKHGPPPGIDENRPPRDHNRPPPPE